ncbi:zinc ribbon domain-containing protein [Oscillochloris sp. ZM17-4]|uniref:FmdB family zinc ribbon protein n=1 Tax=Oscillochloris sp. ZM17-4 TaxID=2866714 RepID=UPI001C735480|nr:FmdB family zinc ribbon protein [Oscillochloris sp. ZM17-4]MBX0330310.1 zinc ribbon domain-containing protein [Oscillochloris sp. ZM17-4]
MPTYVYACKSCGNQFEKFQSFKEDPLTVCPCGQEGQVRRVIQPAGVVFKGSGWYINDSRGSSSTAVVGDTAKAEKTDTADTAEKKADTVEKASTSEKSETSAPAPASPAE